MASTCRHLHGLQIQWMFRGVIVCLPLWIVCGRVEHNPILYEGREERHDGVCV